MEDVENCSTELSDFKLQQLPLARIKKIMKSDEDVRMISAEAPVLFAKACEFFILEMTIRAWHVAEENKRRTLTRQDVSAAVNRTEVWDFLADTIPAEDANAGLDGQGGSIPGRPLGVSMPQENMGGGNMPMSSQMEPYQAQYMAQMSGMANMGAGGPPGMFPSGMRPMPMMYQGMPPPGMYMQGPPPMMPTEQQSNKTSNESEDSPRQMKTRSQKR